MSCAPLLGAFRAVHDFGKLDAALGLLSINVAEERAAWWRYFEHVAAGRGRYYDVTKARSQSVPALKLLPAA
jgi:hypothetical protein